MNNNNLNNQQMMNQQFGGQAPNNNQPMMNNQMQQPMNNQPVNGQQMQQPMNNQPVNGQQMMNQQFGGQAPNNNQPVNGQQMMNQQFGGQPLNNNQYNQNNYQQPMMNNQFSNQPVYNNNQNPNKSKTKLFIIIGSIILGVAILAVVLVLVLGNNKNEDKNYDNENHYEEDNINNSTNDTVNENEYISFKGFDFEKKSGYQYSIDSEGLNIGNNSFATMIEIIGASYEQVKSKSDALIQEYRNMGLDVQNYKVANYDNREVMTFEIAQEGQKMIMYFTEANTNNTILGMAMNRNFTIDYSDVNTTVSLIKGLKYSGNYKAPADEDMVMEFKNLFE